MNITELMSGLVVKSFGGYYVYSQLEKQFNKESLRYVTGFVIYYTNGYVSVSGGGCASGSNLSEFWLLNENGEILWSDEYFDCL